MNWKLQATIADLRKEESSPFVVRRGQGRPVAMVYPNSYYVGMSNLGLHVIYEEINSRNDTSCERIFMPEGKEWDAYEKSNTPLMSMETNRPMGEFEVLGISITFEMDYFNIPKMLKQSRIPVWAKDRGKKDAYVIAGGPCPTFNPEPFADFVDACIVGEGEEVIHEVLDVLFAAKDKGYERRDVLMALAQVSGVYVPSLYTPQFDGIGQIGYSIVEGAPTHVKRRIAPLHKPSETVVVTDYTEFGDMYILEVARGCGRHCRFCMAGYCYRKPRNRSLAMLKEGVDRAAKLGKKVGLMGAAISDYPHIDELVQYIRSKGLRFSCASLRADTLTEEIARGLAESGQKTITVAPEAGSERLRRVINKGITEEDIFKTVHMATKAGIRHIRLYIMIGLPTETMEDIDAIISLANAVQGYMAEVGSTGRLTLSVNPFIPKPFTPFQWMPMADQKEVEAKISYLKKELKQNKRVELLVESPREAYIQGALARGDRRLGAVILEAVERGGAKAFKRACKDLGYAMEAFLYGTRVVGEALPWDPLDMRLRQDYLSHELEVGLAEGYTAPCADGCKRCGVCGGTDGNM